MQKARVLAIGEILKIEEPQGPVKSEVRYHFDCFRAISQYDNNFQYILG